MDDCSAILKFLGVCALCFEFYGAYMVYVSVPKNREQWKAWIKEIQSPDEGTLKIKRRASHGFAIITVGLFLELIVLLFSGW